MHINMGIVKIYFMITYGGNIIKNANLDPSAIVNIVRFARICICKTFWFTV